MRELKRALSSLCRNRAGTWLLLLLAGASAAGSFLPQAPEGARARSDWLVAANDAIGPLARLLSAVRLTDYFESFWFWLPALALLASLTACTAARWRRIWRSPTLYTHLAPMLLFGGVALSWSAAIRQPIAIPPDGEPLPVLAAPGSKVAVTRWLAPAGRDGSPSGYEADVEVRDGDRRVCASTVRPNHPLDCDGVSYVLVGVSSDAGAGASREGASASDPAAASESVLLIAVRDPGFPVVVGALAATLLGSAAALWRPARWRHQ